MEDLGELHLLPDDLLAEDVEVDSRGGLRVDSDGDAEDEEEVEASLQTS